MDDRRILNAMLYKAKSGMAWRDHPERYGPWKAVHNRFWRWSRNGTSAMPVAKVRVIADDSQVGVGEQPPGCGIGAQHTEWDPPGPVQYRRVQAGVGLVEAVEHRADRVGGLGEGVVPPLLPCLWP